MTLKNIKIANSGISFVSLKIFELNYDYFYLIKEKILKILNKFSFNTPHIIFCRDEHNIDSVSVLNPGRIY